MKDYKSYITALAKTASDTVFLNSSHEHASIVMSTIFSHSQEVVFIRAGNLCGDVSMNGYYIDALMDFLDKGGKVNILMNPLESSSLPFLVKLLLSNDHYKGQVDIRCSKEKNLAAGKEFHFTVGDDSMYRIENDIENYSAVGNFNDPIIARSLISLFKKSFEKSTDITTYSNLQRKNIESSLIC